MKVLLTSFLVFVVNFTFCQQFTFRDLMSMLTNKTLFEQNMVKVGNYPTSISNFSNYECRKNNDLTNTIYVYDESIFEIDSTLIDITKITYFWAGFAENYNTEDETGSTFYSMSLSKSKNIKGKPIIGDKDKAILRVQYVRSSDYLKILNQITSSSKYVETKEDASVKDRNEYISVYQFGSVTIEIKKSKDRLTGGNIVLRTNM